MSFNIGSQQGGVINNVAGDQTVHGGQNVTITSAAEALSVVEQLRKEIEATKLSKKSKAEAKGHLDEMKKTLEQPEPDKPSIADRLARLTRLMISGGALVSAGAALVTGLTSLAGWLGAFGSSVMDLIRGATRTDDR